MKVRPLGNRVFCHRLKDEIKSAGGVHIPDTVASKQTFTAEVLAVGIGAFDFQGNLRPVSVNVGDKILFWKGAGTNVGTEAEALTIITEDDILGVLLEPS